MSTTEDPAPRSAADLALERAWETVDQAWDEPEGHRRVLALAVELDALPHVAGLYRAATASREREATARAQLERIVGLAMAKLANSRSDESDSPRRVVLVLRALAFCFLFASVALFVRALFR